MFDAVYEVIVPSLAPIGAFKPKKVALYERYMRSAGEETRKVLNIMN